MQLLLSVIVQICAGTYTDAGGGSVVCENERPMKKAKVNPTSQQQQHAANTLSRKNPARQFKKIVGEMSAQVIPSPEKVCSPTSCAQTSGGQKLPSQNEETFLGNICAYMSGCGSSGVKTLRDT